MSNYHFICTDQELFLFSDNDLARTQPIGDGYDLSVKWTVYTKNVAVAYHDYRAKGEYFFTPRNELTRWYLIPRLKQDT